MNSLYLIISIFDFYIAVLNYELYEETQSSMKKAIGIIFFVSGVVELLIWAARMFIIKS